MTFEPENGSSQGQILALAVFVVPRDQKVKVLTKRTPVRVHIYVYIRGYIYIVHLTTPEGSRHFVSMYAHIIHMYT